MANVNSVNIGLSADRGPAGPRSVSGPVSLSLAGAYGYLRCMARGLSDASYKKLLGDLRRALDLAKSYKSVDQQLVGSYWSIGQRIVQTGALDDASYGDSVVKRLSADLEIDPRTLQRSVAFFDEYESVPETGLSWSHYRELITVSDPRERAFYEQLAVDEALSRNKLVLAIDSDLFGKRGKKKQSPRLTRPTDPRYLFEAELLRIIDGDTLFFRIDLGFEILKEQRVRLKGIDTFDASSDKGKRATQYVADNLSFADRIVLKTHRADLHGRYVADVFYSTRSLTLLDTFERGRYLNQELLDERLAILGKR